MRRLLVPIPVFAVAVGLGAPAGSALSLPGSDATTTSTTTTSAAASAGLPASSEVTLITGDRVTLTRGEDGRHAVELDPARHGDTASDFVTIERDGDLYVIPEDVRLLVPDRLDPALFNVTALIEQGYDDASVDEIPLIVRSDDRRRTGAPELPGAEVTTVLESIDSAAVRLDKDDAAPIGASLAAAAQASTKSARASLPGDLAGIERISLDGAMQANLAESVGQIGAPAAWDAGLDGTGVTVAVIDSGIDTTHPDLTDVVVAERNFTEDPDAVDRNGHGTHIASTIAGTGAASDGLYRGVAGGVDMLSGKVLDGMGQGYFSWTVEAMEWAAEQGADIVNLSLGPREIGQGGEMSEAADALTAQYGTLFVAAAGNNGCVGCVSHPAASASALAVGAVDKSDVLADFSNRGPMPGTSVVKPDVTAPGVEIVAARADGTSMGYPVDNDAYTMAGGTSMATPHVVGAAALLLQSRPDMRPADLKQWLMNTASPQSDATVYEEGAGRIDIAQALSATVSSSPGSLSYGYYPWPHDGRAPDTRTLTYSNAGDEDVVLELAVDVTTADGTAPPAGTVTTTASEVTVPAGGTASVDVVLDTAAGQPGLYGGYVSATAADGTVIRTVVGFHLERELVELRVSGIARDGRPAPGFASIVNVDDGGVDATRNLDGDPAAPCTEDPFSGSTCVLVPPGTYSVLGIVDTMPTYEQPQYSATPLNKSLVGDPELEITEDTEVVLDARKATEVLIDTPEHETKRNLGAAMEAAFYREPVSGPGVSAGRSLYPGAMLEERLFVQPMEEVSKGELAVFTRWRLEAPEITVDISDPQPLALHPMYYRPNDVSDMSDQFPMLDGDLDAPIVDAGLGRTEDIAGADLDGAIALITRSDAIPVTDQVATVADAGAALVMVANDVPGPNSDPGQATQPLSVPAVWISHEEGAAVRGLLTDGPVQASATGTVASPYAYELVLTEHGSVPADLHYEIHTDELARVDSQMHSQLDDDPTMSISWFPYQPWRTYSSSYPVEVRDTPRTLVTYVSPGPDLQWSQTARTQEVPYSGHFGPYDPTINLDLDGERRTYLAGETYEHSWNKQPLHTGATPDQPPTRTQDRVVVPMSVLDGTGNDGTVQSTWVQPGISTDLRVFQGTELLTETDFSSSVFFDAAPDPTRYRVEYDVTNEAAWSQLSTRISSAWTFSTERPADESTAVLPMLGVEYDVDVDLHNRALPPSERRGPHRIGLTFGYPDGAEQAAVDEVTVEVSYDEGATWRDVHALRDLGDNQFTATIDDRRPDSGFLSLRVSAADENGNTVEQEIIRAYALQQR